MSRIVPRETAEKLFQLEVDRLDQIAAGHFETCAGDIASTHVMGARLSLDNEIKPLQPWSSSRPTTDLSPNKPTSVPIMPRKYGSQDWMS